MRKKQLKAYWISALALVEFILLKCSYHYVMKGECIQKHFEAENIIVLFIESILFISVLFILNHWKKVQNMDVADIFVFQVGVLIVVYVLMEYLKLQVIFRGEKYLFIFHRIIPLDQIVYILVLFTPYMLFLLGELYEKKEITDKLLYMTNILCLISFALLPVITNTWKSQFIWLVVYNVSWITFINRKNIYTVILSFIPIVAGSFYLNHKFNADNNLSKILRGIQNNPDTNKVLNMAPELKGFFIAISLVFIATQIYIFKNIDFESKKQKKFLIITFSYTVFLFVLEMVLKLGYIEMQFYRFSLIDSNSGMFIYILWLANYLCNSRNIKKNTIKI